MEGDTIKKSRDEKKKDYLRRTGKLLETKLYCRNLIKETNTCAVHLVRYSGPLLKWTKEDIKQMDQRTRKPMIMLKALHHRNDLDRLYVSRKEGGRGLTSIEDNIDPSRQFEDYREKRGGRLITATRNNSNDKRISRHEITGKQK